MDARRRVGSSSVTSSEQPERATRRPRRAVRHAGTVGGDDANLLSTLPAHTADAVPEDSGDGDRVGAQEAARAREPVVATRSADDSDTGWGERQADSNDDRLSQDKPPHW